MNKYEYKNKLIHVRITINLLLPHRRPRHMNSISAEGMTDSALLRTFCGSPGLLGESQAPPPAWVAPP